MSREETKQILSELHEVSGVSGREYKVGEQKEEGLTIDGIAGNEVWRKIDILMLNKMIEDD